MRNWKYKKRGRKFQFLRDKAKKRELINPRDIVKCLEDFHLRYQEDRLIGWRYVLECIED